MSMNNEYHNYNIIVVLFQKVQNVFVVHNRLSLTNRIYEKEKNGKIEKDRST